MKLSILVPTLNESGNVAELVRRIEAAIAEADTAGAAIAGVDTTEADTAVGAGGPRLTLDNTELIFVDDSTDDTPEEIARVAAASTMSVRCIHRVQPTAGLGGAVLEGARAARANYCLVMDGDLQHPPEKIGELFERMTRGSVGDTSREVNARAEANAGVNTSANSAVDVVIASRYAGGGSARGLANALRHGVSVASALVVKAMFPFNLYKSTDPMTGFFIFDKRKVDLDELRPQGFKILLEILARRRHSIAEIPFDFADRFAGESKASLRQGLHFLRQLFQLRFGRMSGFAIVGGVGALVNIALVWLLTNLGVGVFFSTLIAAEVTIVGNFLLQDRFVFGDLRARTHTFWSRFARSFTFNNVEGFIRIALVVAIVDRGWMGATLATAILLAIAFIARYVFHALVVYAPKVGDKRRP